MASATRDDEAAPLTLEHRRNLRNLHQHLTIPGRELCTADGQEWPCDVIALLDALEVAEKQIQAVADLGVRLRWDRTVNKTATVVRLMLECIGIDHREEMRRILRPATVHRAATAPDPAKPWPGYCQSCGAALTPPNATSCRACGRSDTDE